MKQRHTTRNRSYSKMVEIAYVGLASAYSIFALIICLWELVIQTRFFIQTKNSFQRRLNFLSILFAFVGVAFVPPSIAYIYFEVTKIYIPMIHISLISTTLVMVFGVLAVIHRYKHLSGALSTTLHFRFIVYSKRILLALAVLSLLNSFFMLYWTSCNDAQGPLWRLLLWIQIACIVPFIVFGVVVNFIMQNRMIAMSLRVFDVKPALKGTAFDQEMKRKAEGKRKLFTILGIQFFFSTIIFMIIFMAVSASSAQVTYLLTVGIFCTCAIVQVFSTRLLELFRDTLKKAKAEPKRAPSLRTKDLESSYKENSGRVVLMDTNDVSKLTEEIKSAIKE